MAVKSKGKSIKRSSDIKKKELPINVIDFINHLSKINDPEVKISYNRDFIAGPLWKAVDIDPDSDFYFQIRSLECGVPGGSGLRFYFTGEYKPVGVSRLEVHRFTLEPVIEKFLTTYNSWLEIVKKYNSKPLILGPEERILKQYEDEFYNTINAKLVDEDADYASFDFETQKKIDEYLEGVLGLLDEYKTPENEERISDIKREVQELKEEQTKLPKNQFVRKLSKIFAKARTISVHLVSEIGKGIIVDYAKGFLLGLIS